MPTATISVAFVNPPKAGKKRWTIKASDDVLYGAMPPVAGQMRQGGQYEISYKIDHFNGVDYKVIEAVSPVGGEPAARPGAEPRPSPAPVSTGRYGATDMATAERIFVCGAINAWVSNPNTIGPLAFDEAAAMVRLWRKVWDNTFGLKSVDEQMGDRIPF